MSKEKLLLVGAGGFGRMVAEQAMLQCDCAFVDDGQPVGTEICGILVVGGLIDLPELRKDYDLLVVGIGNNQFGPTVTLAYDQILTMLCRAMGESAAGSDWSAAAVSWASKNGLTDGLTFSAKANCPRSDVVYCLWKQLGASA